jgi:serine/threonine protein kinase
MTAENLGDGCPSEEMLLAHASGIRSAHDHAILAHIDGCEGCRLLVAEATRALSSAALPGTDAAARTLAPGERVVDRYAIRRFIARGGMGEVYEALDLLLDERVALKTLASSVLDDDRAALRFKGEARLARRVTHANVCRILEFGVHVRRAAERRTSGPAGDESVPFLTMEFMCGETLGRRIARRGRQTPEQAVPLLRQIVAGLKAIHDAGIVHRDLKTENVFLVADPHGDERAVVMDFGLARALDGSVLTTWPHLQGAMTGTLDCMAPEQIEGGAVGQAADIYAFGVLLFELLTGHRPFVKISPAHRLIHAAPLASSVLPALARPWDELISRCLAQRPHDRFTDLDELLAALPSATPAISV